MTSRGYILGKRSNPLADLSNRTNNVGGMTVGEALNAGLFKVNASHQVGIATATEVGLTSDRFPIRFVIGGVGRIAPAIDTCVSYWRLADASGAYINFQRKAVSSDATIKTLYKHVPSFDTDCWAAWDAIRENNATDAYDPALNANQDTFLTNLSVLVPTAEQIAMMQDGVRAIIAACVTGNRIPYFKVGANLFIKACPHGTMYAQNGALSADNIAAYEAFLTIQVNYSRIHARHPSVPTGSALLGAYSVASMFRMGLFEAYEHQEYYTVRVEPVANQNHQFSVAQVIHAPGVPALAGYEVGSVIDVSPMRIDPVMMELGNLAVILSGLMHYLFNHTTGGSMITGPLLSAMLMYKQIDGGLSSEIQTEITSVMYESLHPTNKRAIANMLLPNSGVTTCGRMRGAPRHEKIQLDTFASIRMNPYPAGAHKAFICITALKKVLTAQLGVFLPWSDRLTDCIDTCKSVLDAGARAHVGSNYYTGEPPQTQPAGLDDFMPELALYVQTFNRGDSLCYSPHVGTDVAARAEMHWKNLMKDLKAKDVSATSAEVVRRFLQTQGGVYIDFDPEKEETWASAAEAQRVAILKIQTCTGF